MGSKKYDFGGWATKNDLRCSDGRTIRKDAFIDDDGHTVPLVWQHQHNSPENVLGHALLENREEGVYAYCTFNETDFAKHAKELVKHGDIKSLSIYANQLKQQGGNVLHGAIREVSLVLTGANPGATIDFPMLEHSDGSYTTLDDSATIYTGEDICLDDISHAETEDKKEDEPMEKDKTVKDIFDTFNEDQKNLLYFFIAQVNKGKTTPAVQHSDDEEDIHIEHAEGNGPTVKEVFDSLNEDQKKVLYFLVGKAAEESGKSVEPEAEKTEVEHSDYEGGTDFMKHNVFEGENTREVISHADMADIFANAKRSGSLKTAFEAYADVIQHSVEDIDYLFPDYKELMKEPDFLKRDDEWVSKVWNATHKSPFSRIKTTHADITADEARAKGYIKGHQKVEEIFTLMHRTTDPQTVYKLQKLDRDDILDITDFNVVAWIKAEMRVMLNEELARAVLVGDGRVSGNDKIDPLHIRPIWTDADLYTIHKEVTIPSNATNYDTCEAIIEGALRARNQYKGSGKPTAYCTPDILTTMLLAKDTTGRRIYNSEADLAAALRVKEIVEVPVMEGLTRTDSSSGDHDLLMIICNLNDYNIGADKGGEVNMFDDFDIDYNKYSYLIETRVSGALTKPKSAIVLETPAAR